MNEAERNADTVRRGYAAFNSADMKTLTEARRGVMRLAKNGEIENFG